MDRLKVIQIGCGKMGKYTMRYVQEHGADVVAAFDRNKDIIGLDISKIMDTPEEKKILVSNVEDLDAVIKEVKPNIAIIETMSLLKDLRRELRICTRNGVNVITTCEEAFFAENSNPHLWKEIDTLAKANNCTVTGCGYQDVFWGNLITVLAGTTHKIAKIKGSSSYNVEDYGIALAKAHGAGLSLDDFDKQVASVDRMSDEERQRLIDNGEFLPSYMWNTVGWLADRMKLHITKMTQVCVPQTCDHDLESKTLNMTIKAGDATGMSAVVTAETEEGITLEAECIGKVYAEDEVDTNEWTVIGEPETTITVRQPATVELTCADIVNRIPDVINARPGFVPTSEMRSPKYRLEDLNTYVEE